MKCVRLHPKQGRLILSLLYTQLTSPLCPCWTPTNPPKKRPAGRWGVFGAAKAPPKQRGCPPVDARAFVLFPVTPFFLCGSYPRPFASLRTPSPVAVRTESGRREGFRKWPSRASSSSSSTVGCKHANDLYSHNRSSIRPPTQTHSAHNTKHKPQATSHGRGRQSQGRRRLLLHGIRGKSFVKKRACPISTWSEPDQPPALSRLSHPHTHPNTQIAAVINFPLWKASAIGQSGFQLASVDAGSSALARYVAACGPPYRGVFATWAGYVVYLPPPPPPPPTYLPNYLSVRRGKYLTPIHPPTEASTYLFTHPPTYPKDVLGPGHHFLWLRAGQGSACPTLRRERGMGGVSGWVGGWVSR